MPIYYIYYQLKKQDLAVKSLLTLSLCKSNINSELNKGTFFGVGCNSLLAVKAMKIISYAAVRDLFAIMQAADPV